MKLYHGVMLVCFFIAQLCLGSQSYYSHPNNSEGDFGVGFEFGEPMGVTAKYWLDNKVALQLGVGYSWREYWIASMDFLFHGQYKTIRPYIGIGGELAFNHYNYWWREHYWQTAFAARIPIGFEFKKDGFGFFAEVCPGLVFVHEVEPMIQGGVGIRFYLQ